ncbi:MAG TPA: hypothetical protein VMM27_11260 [Casimicrobiaceae bacterium]|nr:hypothetical protein [Casimicrobiaceae bacterium]
MLTALWTLFAVAVMAGVFAGCVIVVATGIRLFENWLARRRQTVAK